jgi:DNA modification methylase
MISMWDAQFTALAPSAGEALDAERGWDAYAAMHTVLDEVWSACRRVIAPGGLLCINIGDAVRSVGGEFLLYPNHSRILQACIELGFHPLPSIIWYKPANSPTKFMGSGMLPPGAYVTLEHEYILLLRNGPRRTFTGGEEKERRRASAFFWEERNRWFTNLWDLRGVRQALERGELRTRSAAFPFELPFRLIQMYSLIGDTVLDPFLGTGTSLRAAAASGRHSVGVEVSAELAREADRALHAAAPEDCGRMTRRLEEHLEYVEQYRAAGKEPRHRHAEHGYPVITAQERELQVPATELLQRRGPGAYTAHHRPLVPGEGCTLRREGWQTDELF